MDSEEINALALEYKQYYGTAGRNLDITDIMNNPNARGIVCVFGPGFSEEITDLPTVKLGSVISEELRLKLDNPLIFQTKSKDLGQGSEIHSHSDVNGPGGGGAGPIT